MPTIFSKELATKILGREWSFGYNCYEVGHSWTPSCTHAALEVSIAAGTKVLPLYTLLYTFSQIGVQRKLDLPASWETIKSIARSSFFIFFHAYNGVSMACLLRRICGRFYYRVLVCIPALISSYLSILIEKPARRQALAFYLLNLASEILFRMAVTKGFLKPLNHGETLLFALSLAAWYNLIKRHGFGHDPISAVVKILIGRDEGKSRAKNQIVVSKSIENNDDDIDLNILKSRKLSVELPKIRQKQERLGCGRTFRDIKLSSMAPDWLVGGRHCTCPHSKSSCLHYVFGPLPSRVLIGWSIQTLLKLIGRPQLLLTNPGQALKDAATAKGSIRFGFFLGSLVTSGRLVSCLLRRYSNSNDCAWHATVAGFVSGLSMLWAPRSSLSMYVMWKAVEQYYLLAARQGKVRYFNFTIMTIYSMSAATILYAFALEPQFVRPSYMKFLDNLSDHRLHQLNRMVLDVFGTGASIGYEDYFPDLDPKCMSNQFKELIFNWMIQPYE